MLDGGELLRLADAAVVVRAFPNHLVETSIYLNTSTLCTAREESTVFGLLVHAISKLPHLKRLKITIPPAVTPQNFSLLSQLNGLELDISNETTDDARYAIIDQIKQLRQLEYILIANDSTGRSRVWDIVSLRRLCMSNSMLSLVQIELTKTHVTAQHMECLVHLSSLRYLDAYCLTRDALPFLPRFGQLWKVDLQPAEKNGSASLFFAVPEGVHTTHRRGLPRVSHHRRRAAPSSPDARDDHHRATPN